jgi:hypothetical protein
MYMLQRMKMMGWGTAMMLSAAFVGTGAIAQTLNAPGMAPPATGMAASSVTPTQATQQEKEEYRKKREEQLLIALDNAYQNNIKLHDAGVKPEEVGSLLFTIWEHMLLDEWRKGVTTAAPTPGEEKATAGTAKGLREISLAGIAYVNKDNWTIWLNGQRMKPNSLPREVMDINVGKQYVELKWYDASTNLIYPVRLRPHQRFNLDSRIFLPGTPASN